MPMTLVISLRPECPEDQEFLFALYASTRDEEMKLVSWPDSQKHAFLKMQFELQSTHYHQYYPSASYQIILSQGRPIGRLYIHRTENQILLIDIALLPQHRRTGIGGQLLGGLLAEARATQKTVAIHVERNNPALRLYTRLGFRVIEDKGMYYYMEWNPAAPDSAKIT
jgi:ribosomal protein S18 acetylase RimI-like enzyme